MRKLSGINFNYTYSLYLVLIIRIDFDKNLISPQHTGSKNPGQIKVIRTGSQFTEYVQNQISNQIQQGIYKFLLFFLFT